MIAFSILVTGSETLKAETLLCLVGIPLPPQNLLNTQLKVIGAEIMKMARKSCEDALRGIPFDSIIALDGSYEHRRKAQRCIVIFFCINTKKIIIFSVKSSRMEDGSDAYCEEKGSLELYAVRDLIQRLKNDPRIIRFIHDKDARISSAFRKEWQITEQIDPGHATKSFERTLGKYRDMIEPWVCEKLASWIKMIIASANDEEKKVALWLNSINHFMGDHTHCPGPHAVTPRVWDE
jgi:hypothetical protein